jgi:hypothetical protein
LVEPYSNLEPIQPDLGRLFKEYEPIVKYCKNGCGVHYTYWGPTKGKDKYGNLKNHGYGVEVFEGEDW